MSAGLQFRRLVLGIWVSGVLSALTASPLQFTAKMPGSNPAGGAGNDSQETDLNGVIANLRKAGSDLTEAVKRFQTDLAREIALHDRGYRTEGGRRIPGADADLTGGPGDLTGASIRRLFAARMIAASRPGYQPVAVADADRIQILLGEARRSIAASNDVMRQFLIVSAKELSARTVAELKVKREELLKVRVAAMEAVRKGLAALPVELPVADSPEEQRDQAWDLITAKPSGPPRLPQKAREDDAAIPISLRLEPGRRITLVNEHYRRVALTDTGIEDGQGRRLFYQEEWEQRLGAVTMQRWAVAVNTLTGQHIVLRRYGEREFHGDFGDLYQWRDRDFLWPAELPELFAPPSLQQVTSAAAEAEQAREDLREAMLFFRTQMREARLQNDAWLAARDNRPPDEELPNILRESLFTIRAHMAGTAAVLEAENRVRQVVERATRKVRNLEATLAWLNAAALEQEAPAGDSRAWTASLKRGDSEIDLTRALEREAMAMLPPDTSRSEAQFPALMKDVIVRIRRVPPPAASEGIVRCRQEVWRRGGAQVERIITFIELGLKTGNQIPTAREVKYYRVEAEDTLESIYDENAAQ